jgi:hypothetical protein
VLPYIHLLFLQPFHGDKELIESDRVLLLPAAAVQGRARVFSLQKFQELKRVGALDFFARLAYKVRNMVRPSDPTAVSYHPAAAAAAAAAFLIVKQHVSSSCPLRAGQPHGVLKAAVTAAAAAGVAGGLHRSGP